MLEWGKIDRSYGKYGVRLTITLPNASSPYGLLGGNLTANAAGGLSLPDAGVGSVIYGGVCSRHGD